MVEVSSSLSHFEDRNSFQPLQLKDEEAVGDVESPEEILNRLIRYASELADRTFSADDVAYKAKKRCFEEGELDEGWTIVANRRPKRSSSFSVKTTEEDTPPMSEEKPAKPNFWRRGIFALGAVAAIGLASLWLRRRPRHNH